jgi:hypothetical protein
MKKLIILLFILSNIIYAQENWQILSSPRVKDLKSHITFFQNENLLISEDGYFVRSESEFENPQYYFFDKPKNNSDKKPSSNKLFSFGNKNYGIYIHSRAEVYVTHDNGEHWAIEDNLRGEAIVFTKEKVGFLFDDYVYKTKDFGMTWQKLPADKDYFDYGDVASVFAKDSLNLWVIKKQRHSAAQETIINCFTKDGGVTWEPFNPFFQKDKILNFIDINMNNEGVGFISGYYKMKKDTSQSVNFLMKTLDGGNNWIVDSNLSYKILDIECNNNKEWLFFIEGEGDYYYSNNNLQTWEFRCCMFFGSFKEAIYNPVTKKIFIISNSDLKVGRNNFMYFESLYFHRKQEIGWLMYDQTNHSAHALSNNYGSAYLLNGNNGSISDVNLSYNIFQGQNILFINKTFYSKNFSKILYSINNGSFEYGEIDPPIDVESNFYFSVSPERSLFLISDKKMYYKSNTTPDWIHVPIPKTISVSSMLQYEEDKLIASIKFAFDEVNKDGILLAEDGGLTWRFFDRNVVFSRMIRLNDGSFLGLNLSDVSRSLDEGKTWSPIEIIEHETYGLNMQVYKDNYLIVATSKKIYIWDLRSNTLIKKINILPQFEEFVSGYLMNDDQLVALTKNKYLIKVENLNLSLPSYDIPENQTEINLVESDNLLSQNYPNPFNPITNINYYVMDNEFVSLKVYDVLGNEIAVLVNEMKSKGNYQAAFDGSNLPSGLYIYKLNVGSYSQVKKMMLLK